jgi:hypothetical protein
MSIFFRTSPKKKSGLDRAGAIGAVSKGLEAPSAM